MKIYAPVKDFNGCRGNVRFINGVGETNDPCLIKWFETHGYTVENCDISMEKLLENCDIAMVEIDDESVELMGYSDKEPNFDEMTPNELRDWAKANGYGSKIKNIRNKEKLIEILRG